MNKTEFMKQAETLYEELRAWRAAHDEASFDEIAEQVTGQRQKLMGELLRMLAEQNGQGEMLEERNCAACGGVLHYKGKKQREVLHPEGTAALERGYHHCDECGHGVFPPG
ncbi:MAG: hypothetical protein HC780_23630 [Leptolyngbyaceae cyanobacterium CSU_1_3]|nr:hypothetical protein [Leptolyngbyaceae cyanobacterium CSU_1_3]